MVLLLPNTPTEMTVIFMLKIVLIDEWKEGNGSIKTAF